MEDFIYNEQCKFNEDWCSKPIRIALQKMVAANAEKDLNGINVEIGCFEGKSTVVHANALYPETLVAIDPWVPVAYAPSEIEKYAANDIEAMFLHNIKVGTQGNVVIMKMGWEEAFAELEAPVKYLYLDGPHSYGDVTHQLETVYPRIISGGTICGDDYLDVQVKKAVNDFFREGDMTYPGSPQTWYKVKP
jgi:hypothetical protein